MIRAATSIFVLLFGCVPVARGQLADAEPAQAASESGAEAIDQNVQRYGAAEKSTATKLAPVAAKEGARRLRFRRVYVPESELLDRVKRQERYVPLSAADFEAALQRLQNRQAADVPQAAITYASYSARLDSGYRLQGSGEWHIHLVGKKPVLLPLGGLGLAMRDPHWRPAQNLESSAPATLGATEHNLALYADRSGSVLFDWSLAGSLDRERRWTYALALPPCPAQRIELTLPADLKPALEGAAILGSTRIDERLVRWTIDLVGHRGGLLRLSNSDEPRRAPTRTVASALVAGRRTAATAVPSATVNTKAIGVYRPRVTYELSPKGLQLSAEWQIDALGEPIGQVEVEMDPDLSLLSATATGTDTSWSEAAEAADESVKRIVLKFSEPLQGSRLIRLIAVAPLKANSVWQLPQVNTPELVWQDGTIALVVAAPLELQKLDLANCRQDKRESLPAPALGEAVGIQAFGPSATVAVQVEPQKERLELKSATTIELLESEAIGSYVAEIVAEDGERFQLTADISPDWIVDSVQSSPPEMIADWDRQRGEDMATRLVIQLAKSINRDRPVRLTVHATRRRSVLGDKLGSEDLRLLTFHGIASVRRLVHMRSTPSYRLEITGDEGMTRLDPAKLDASDRDLLGETLEGLLFLNDETVGDLQINVLAQRPRLSAALQTHVVVGDRQLKEACEIRINPESNEVAQVLVHFSQARSEAISWSIKDSAEVPAARRLTRQEQAALGIGDGGETWEVRPGSARSIPFVLAASRASELKQKTPVALASLLHAPSQQGSVRVELQSEFVPELVERRLKSMAVEPAPPGAYQNMIASYEYDPTEDLLIAKEPALELLINRDPARRRQAWVWRCALDAWFAPSGSVQCQARFYIENAGRSQVILGLPPDELSAAAPSIVEVDGSAASATSWDGKTGKLSVSLPVGRRYAIVDVAWSETASALSGVSSRNCWWPSADVPILRCDGTAWMPRGYLLANGSGTSNETNMRQVSWRERLFGPLGRPSDRETFEPWLTDEWSRFLENSSAGDASISGDAAFDRNSATSPANAMVKEWPIWPRIEPASAGDMPNDGWTPYRLVSPANDGTFDLLIVRRQLLLALGVGLFLTSTGFFWRLSRRSSVLQVLVLGVVVIVALLLPTVFAPLGAASVLGFLGGKLCRLVFSSGDGVNRQGIKAQPVAATAVSVCVLAWLWTATAVAQMPPAAEANIDSSSIYDVLIPVDGEGHTAGDKVYVPEALYEELMARPDDDNREQRYLITSSEYEGFGQASATGGPSSPPLSWKASMSVAVLKSPARVVLPLSSEVQIIPDSGRLNGQPLRFGWDEAQRLLYFNVNQPGTAKVEFEFRPNGSDDWQTRGVTFAIPRVAQSKLRLPAAVSAKPPRILAIGGMSRETDSREYRAELGPIGQVQITWSDAASADESPPQFDSDESTWLRLRPGSAVLNARLAIQVRRGDLTELTLALDKRLIPLPVAGQSPIERIVRVSDTEARLQFSQPVRDRAVMDLAFVVRGVNGPGRYGWPEVEIKGAATSRRRIACSVDQTLELVSLPTAGARPLNGAQFATIWGEPDARPLAFELGMSPVDWLLEVRARQAGLASRYRSIVELSGSFAEMAWDASVEISGGSRYQIRVAVPPELQVEHVEIRDEAGIRPSRWAVGDGRTLTVFFDTAAAGNLRLLMRGRLPVNADGRLTVPLLEVDGSAQKQASLYILRRTGVLATIERKGALREIDAKVAVADSNNVDPGLAAETATSHSHLLAALDATNAQGPIVLRVQKNAPRVEAKQAMSLLRRADAWHAALDFELEVSEGVLDSVRIDAPASWSAPFTIEPATPNRVIEVPGENRRQLLLLLPQPVAGVAKFRIEGRLSPAAGQRVRAPDARVVNVASLEQYFALPLQQNLQTLAWETRGLKPATIPADLLRTSTEGRTVQTFVRAAEQFRAELRSVEKIADDVRVRLADVAVSFSRNGECYGAASLDIEPAGRASCRLALPEGSRLVHLSVDGRPLFPAPAGDLRWQIPLGGGRLPQRIEIVYAGQIPAAADSPVIESPKLIGIPIERTLWTVSGPPSLGAATVAEIEPLTPLQIEAARYESIGGLIESTATTAAEVALEQTPNWYAAWARRMIAARESIVQLQEQVEESRLDPVLTARTELVDQDQDRLAERLGTYELLDELWNEPPPDESPVAAWNASMEPTRRTWQGMLPGDTSSIQLGFPNRADDDYSSQAISALFAAAWLLGAVALARYSPAPQWFGQRPRYALAAFGVFWWLFLWPSAAGWAIVVAAALVPYLHGVVDRRVSRRKRLPARAA